jgi:asparagine synthase (glutamine-hydrolysing)
MGGIAGFVQWDNIVSSEQCIGKMVGAIPHRGNGHFHFSRCNKSGFVQFLDSCDNAYQESADISLPIPDTEYIVVFHGRIDNRNEIHKQLDPEKPFSYHTNESTCLAAFRQWGHSCASKLTGDFTFSIWDEQAGLLYCFRDRMGVKPFYYVSSPSFFAFASEIKALLALPFIKKELNNEKIADYLLWFATEEKATFFKDIYRLRPSHYLIVSNDKVLERKYWEPGQIQLSTRSFEENSESFFHIFKDAVSLRLPKEGAIGSFLSGGIDSSSIVCMVAGGLSGHYCSKIHTFSHIYNRLYRCDEQRYFKPIIDRYNIDPHFVNGDEIDPASAFDNTAAQEDEPFEGPHFFAGWHLLHLAKRKKIMALFDGHDGDSTLSLGVGLFPQLAQRGRILKLYSEILACNPQQHKRAIKLFLSTYSDFLKAKMPFLSYQSKLILQLGKYQKYVTPYLLENTHSIERILSSLDTVPLPLQSEQQRHFNNIFQPFHSHALEYLERASSRFGICACFPYFDHRLISFCLSLPAEHKLRKGYNRAYVRNSLKHILPEEIRKRRDKTNFIDNVLDAYLVRARHWFEASYHDAPSSVYQYVDKEEIRKMFQKCIEHEPVPSLLSDLHKILRFFSLAKWLKKIG